MDRIRDGRRGGMSVGGGPPPPRRRLRSNGGGGGSAGPRDSPRSERRRGERLMLNGGGAGAGRDDGDDTSDESLGDDDDDAEEELAPRYQQQRRSPSTAPPPPSPPQPGGGHHHSSSSSGGGGGGYHNHHHHGQQLQRKGGGSNPKSPIVVKAVDEMIGVPVPRKARSASTKRSSHEWPVPGGGTSGGSAGAGEGSQIQRPSSRPISPASTSTTAPVRKKLKPLGGGGSSGGSGTAPKQRPSPSPSPAPSTAPPQPPAAPKISKSPSFIQEEIEVAEVLFGLTRQFPCPPKQESNHKLEPRDAPEAKSGNSSPAPSSSGLRPSDSTSLSTIAPKRKRPRLVKYDEDSRPASPAKPELAEPSSRPEAPPVARSEAKASTSAAAESGTSAAPAAAQLETSRELDKAEDHGRSRDSELRPSESDRRDHKLESLAEPPATAPAPAPSVKPDAEATPVGSEARNGEATATTKIELASDGSRQEKFCIDLMAPPPGKLSPDRDGSSDPDADKKGLDSQMDMLGRGISEKKDGDRTRRGLDIDLEDHKVQRIPSDEPAPKKLTLQLDLEKPSLGDEKSPTERRQPQQPQQQQKPSKSEIKHEKSSMPAVTPPMPIPVGGWLGSFPPFGYLPVPGLSAAGLHHPMDVKPGSSSGLQHAALLPPPTRSKRCATHCYIAQFIQHQQRVAKMNSFWPPAVAAAATANRSGPFFGARPFNMGAVPPTDAASLLVNPMQGSYPVRAHTPMQEAKAPSIAASPFQGNLSKDKSLGNAAGAESSQRKQPPAHETQQSTPMPNMLQTPAFIFPFNQQQAAAVAAANAANRAGDAKSSAASNAMPPSASAHTSAANPGAAAMNLSFANLQPADAQFLAILQNGAYPFQVAAHAGGPPSYRGMPPPGGPAVPFFNGHVYSPHMMHPSQQQGAQQQSHQKTPMPTLSSSSQKHQQQQSPGLLGYAPSAAATAASNSQNYSSGNQRPVLLPGLTHRQEGDKAGQDGPSSDDKPSHSQKGGYEHSFAVPVNLPNFAMMPAAQAAGSLSEKKSSDHHHHQQQQTQVSRGQGVRIDLASSQPFVMPFGSIGPPGSAPTGLDFSALAAQNHAVFHHQEAARHGYPQLNFAAAQSVQATQHKPQHQITGEAKSVAGDSSATPSTADSERKKSTSTKYPGDSQQHSLSFTRTDNKSYVAPFLSGNTNEGSSRTLSLIGTEPPNAFGMGSKSTNSPTPASSPAAASSAISHQQHHQQQHFLQMHPKHQQQLIQHHHLNRPRSAAPSTPNSAGGYPDRLSFQNMYPSSAAQGGVQSPQLKASSGRGTPSAATTPSAAPPSNLIVMKNSSHHPQQAKVPMQALSTPGHQSQSSLTMSSSKMGPSNLSTGGDLSRSSNAPVASGSPSNSVSKSTGGSPPAPKIVQQSVQLSSPQQQSSKNPSSTSGSKSTPTNHFSMPSILGQQPNISPGSNPGSKQQSHMQPSSLKQPTYPQGQFFISSNYGATQALGASAAPPGLYQKRPGDKSQQQAPHQQNAMSAAASNNMKTLHPSSGGFMHLAAAAQSAGGMPHSHMPAAQLTFGVGAMPMPVKPSSDQKPAAGK
ncbi:hypothetical protein BS78_02G321400 [Paspalum vaginatum]|nr:hypothetical protein BS78_02G321400 [Paspalum vaginatum]